MTSEPPHTAQRSTPENREGRPDGAPRVFPRSRRVKTQGSLPNDNAAVVLLFSLVVSGQIKLRKIDGWRKIAAVLSQGRPAAA